MGKLYTLEKSITLPPEKSSFRGPEKSLIWGGGPPAALTGMPTHAPQPTDIFG